MGLRRINRIKETRLACTGPSFLCLYHRPSTRGLVSICPKKRNAHSSYGLKTGLINDKKTTRELKRIHVRGKECKGRKGKPEEVIL